MHEQLVALRQKTLFLLLLIRLGGWCKLPNSGRNDVSEMSFGRDFEDNILIAFGGTCLLTGGYKKNMIKY